MVVNVFHSTLKQFSTATAVGSPRVRAATWWGREPGRTMFTWRRNSSCQVAAYLVNSTSSCIFVDFIFLIVSGILWKHSMGGGGRQLGFSSLLTCGQMITKPLWLFDHKATMLVWLQHLCDRAIANYCACSSVSGAPCLSILAALPIFRGASLLLWSLLQIYSGSLQVLWYPHAHFLISI